MSMLARDLTLSASRGGASDGLSLLSSVKKDRGERMHPGGGGGGGLFSPSAFLNSPGDDDINLSGNLVMPGSLDSGQIPPPPLGSHDPSTRGDVH